MAENRDVERLGAFTDGVLAIAITLLVLDINLPEGVGAMNDAALGGALIAIWPKYLGYLISFLVIGNYWLIHTAKFRELKAVNHRFIVLNILFLLVVGFIPFATSVLSENDGRIATMLYAATMAIASALLAVMGFYAENKGLVERPETGDRPVMHILRSLLAAMVFFASIIVAEFDASLARYCWLLLFPAAMIARPRGKKEAAEPF